MYNRKQRADYGETGAHKPHGSLDGGPQIHISSVPGRVRADGNRGGGSDEAKDPGGAGTAFADRVRSCSEKLCTCRRSTHSYSKMITYKIPTKKTEINAILRRRLSCSCQRTKMGIIKSAKSATVLRALVETSAACELIVHTPVAGGSKVMLYCSQK